MKLSSSDGGAFTAVSAVLAVEEVLSHARASAYIPAPIFGKDFTQRIAGTSHLDGIRGDERTDAAVLDRFRREAKWRRDGYQTLIDQMLPRTSGSTPREEGRLVPRRHGTWAWHLAQPADWLQPSLTRISPSKAGVAGSSPAGRAKSLCDVAASHQASVTSVSKGSRRARPFAISLTRAVGTEPVAGCGCPAGTSRPKQEFRPPTESPRALCLRSANEWPPRRRDSRSTGLQQ